jgi:hypothetical protein
MRDIRGERERTRKQLKLTRERLKDRIDGCELGTQLRELQATQVEAIMLDVVQTVESSKPQVDSTRPAAPRPVIDSAELHEFMAKSNMFVRKATVIIQHHCIDSLLPHSLPKSFSPIPMAGKAHEILTQEFTLPFLDLGNCWK